MKKKNLDIQTSKDYGDEIEEDILNYSLSAIVRAIPDLRDGLKPVHRRILYVMKTEHNTYDKAYRKTVKTVGSTLSRFHPHGDSSVYDAMVRMAQDFKMRVPLIDGQGNYGSVDGDSAAASRYCITGDTLILTDKGYVRIDSIVPNSELDKDYNIELKILSKDNVLNSASKFFNSGVHKTYLVELQNGMEVTGTSNHPLLVLDDNLSLKWKTIAELQTGDKVLFAKNGNIFGTNNDLLEAQMLGCMISEGYITTQNRIGISNTDIDMITPVKKYFEREIETTGNINKNKRRNYYEYCIANKDYYPIFIDKYNYKEKALLKEIPECVFNGTKSYQKEFLKYLFEGDGSVSYNYSPYVAKDYGKVTYSTYSKKLAKQIQLLLLNFGILSSILLSKGKEYKINISSKDVFIFKDKIGFVSKRKNDVLNKIILPEIVPNNGYYYLKEMSDFIKSKDSRIKRKITNIDKLNKYKNYLSEEIYNKCLAFLNNYGFSEIKSITYAGKQPVYSIRVDSDCHSFVGNGIINHNTEARLSKEAEYLLEDLEKNTVPMVDNFDGLEQEPLVLPARIPNLYINGSQGIAIGIATNIPTHNPKEIIDAIIYYIDHKKVKLEKLLEIMPGPDFPTGGIIINKDELINLYKTGLGRVVTRAKLEYKHNKVGKDSIIVTEIPYSYSGNKTKIIEVINDCIINKTLAEISEVRDESDKNGICINLVLKKELTKEEFKKIESKLYKFTPLQTSETYNFMVTDNLRPKQIGLLEYIENFYDFQKELTKNKYTYLIDKYQARLEILDGLKKALDLIDVIIEIARYSKNNQAIKDCLMKGDISNIKFKTKTYETKAKKLCFSERQALAIMAIKLQDLSNFEVLELEKEYLDIQKKISDAQKIISDSKALDSEIKKYLNQYKKELDVPRKTIITNDKIDTYKEEKVIEDVYFCIDKFNYIKVINENELESNPECQYLNSNNDDKIIIFCDDGNAYTFKTEDILKTKNMSARGILLDTLLKTKNNEDLEILFVTAESNLNNLKLLFVSTDAFIKTCMADEFVASKTVLKATVLNSGARVAKIYDVSDNLGTLELISDKDRKIVRPIKDIQTYKKTSRGVIGLKLKDSESIKEINVKNKTF